jgi:hypothetical protein
MIARGLILLGFRPSGMRTGQESLKEGGHTSSLWGDESAGNYGSRKAYHLIFYFLSEVISALFVKRWRTINTFIFCTVVMIVIAV